MVGNCSGVSVPSAASMRSKLWPLVFTIVTTEGPSPFDAMSPKTPRRSSESTMPSGSSTCPAVVMRTARTVASSKPPSRWSLQMTT